VYKIPPFSLHCGGCSEEEGDAVAAVVVLVVVDEDGRDLRIGYFDGLGDDGGDFEDLVVAVVVVVD